MSGMEIDQHICKEAQFVDENYVALVQRVTSVMALADDLKSKDMIHEEKYSEIKAARTNQGKMRKLYEALHSGGDKVKTAFYNALREHEPLLFNKLESLKRSPTEPKKKEMLLTPIPRLKISYLEASGLYLHPSSPDCQACVHIVDSDQWVKVEPSVCRDERESKFRISTPLGRYECIRTRLRWVCDCDVTLQYRAVDGCSLTAELERLQCERIGPVIDVTVISGKLKEAHLPHYACLAESDPSLKDAVKVLSQKDEGFELQSVELTRFHAKILQPSFSLTTLIINWLMKWEEHFNLLLYMRCNHPLILHVYFFPLNDTCLKEKVEQNEKSSIRIPHPRPNRPFRMKTPHLLEVPGASVHPKEGISFRRDTEPNFFKVKQDQDGRETQEGLQSEAVFVDENYPNLVQRVTAVMPLADDLKSRNMIHEEKYSEIIAETTNQGKMRKLYEALRSGGDEVKTAFYNALREHEPRLFDDLHGVPPVSRHRRRRTPVPPNSLDCM